MTHWICKCVYCGEPMYQAVQDLNDIRYRQLWCSDPCGQAWYEEVKHGDISVDAVMKKIRHKS